jgi:hypothetical protein
MEGVGPERTAAITPASVSASKGRRPVTIRIGRHRALTIVPGLPHLAHAAAAEAFHQAVVSQRPSSLHLRLPWSLHARPPVPTPPQGSAAVLRGECPREVARDHC